MKIQPIDQRLCILGEGPVWNPADNRIYWIDIVKGHIHSNDVIGNNPHTLATHDIIGSFAFCEDGRIIAALQKGLVFIDPKNGEVEMIGDPESHLPQNRFNDGKCDPAGRFWAGTLPLSEDHPGGNLYRVDQDLSIHKILDSITISNGLCWSHDHQYFYFIDTPTLRVDRFDYDDKSGSLSNRQTILTIDPKDGYPDGMTIDREGMLWIAHWGGWQVTRWNPPTGEKIGHIELPVSQVTSLCFGGENFDTLFITSARRGLSEEALIKEPLAGATFIISDIPYNGNAFHTFQPQPTWPS
jgi:sugar lactone lactonase YvrE